MIKNAIGKILLSDNTMAGYVSDRIYPVIAPQEAKFPFVVIKNNSTQPTDIKDGVSPLDEADIQIDVYSDTVSTLNSIMAQTRILLDRYSGNISGSNIDAVIFVNESDGPFEIDTEIFAKSQDYRIRINRT
jgi:hypothetical protein